MYKKSQNNSIKSWAEDDRPREKMLLKGKAALSDAELLAIIMGSGNKEETAVDLAKRILADSNNNWHELTKKSINELCQYKGIGEAKAIAIVTALEIGKRRAKQLALEKPKISSSKVAYDMLSPIMADLNVEAFYVLLLNQSNKVIGIEKLSSGGISATLVDVRILFKKAIEKMATAIIVAQNHQSGNQNPSKQDIAITKSIKNAGETLTIPVLDHLIITQTNYFSFADNGLL